MIALLLLALLFGRTLASYEACGVVVPVDKIYVPKLVSNATFLMEGVLPKGQWHCGQSSNDTPDANRFNGVGLFVNRHVDANWLSVAVFPSHPTNRTWVLYWWQGRYNGGDVHQSTVLAVCKFPVSTLALLTSGHRCDQGAIPSCADIPATALECLVNVSVPTAVHSFSYVTWHADSVVLSVHGMFYELSYNGLMWSNVTVFCYDSAGCHFNIPNATSTWLVQTNGGGLVDNHVDCSQDFESEIKCRNQVFELTPAVYSGATFEPPQAFYYTANDLPNCNFSFASLFADGSGQYTGLRRHVFSDCYSNYTHWLSCDEAVWSGCLLFNAIFDEARFNLTQPDGLVNPFVRCNGLDPFSITRGCSPGYVLRYELVNNTAFDPNHIPDYMECFGYFQIFSWRVNDIVGGAYIAYSAHFLGTGMSVCVKQPTVPELGVCKSYTVDGINFQGSLSSSSVDFSSMHNVLYYGDIISYVRIKGQSYAVEPCATGFYNVFKSKNAMGFLYMGARCNSSAVTTIASKLRTTPNYINSTVGCLVNVNFTNNNYSDCANPIGNGLCVDVNVTDLPVVGNVYIAPHNTDYARPILSPQEIYLPLDHAINVKEQYVQTSAPKFDVDCERYICDVSQECRALLAKYGGYCSKISADIRSSSIALDYQILGLYKTLNMELQNTSVDFGNFNFSMFLPNGGSRSFIEDLLFDKLETTGPGFYQDYYNCREVYLQDVTCKQYYNGIMVIPPIMNDDQITMWSSFIFTSMTASMFGGQAGMVSWSIALAGRLNALGVMQNMLVDDINKLANGFNNLTQYVAAGFNTTSQALVAIQAVVNNNAQQVSQLVQGLSENFGAISNNFALIAERLERIEASMQMDRLINGRMNILQSFVTNYKVSIAELKSQQALAQQLINECVYAQSTRNGFCGDGLHLFSVMQRAPDGIMFLHYTLVPNKTALFETTPGLCLNNSVCIAPKDGLFVRNITRSSDWHFTARNLYTPTPITVNNTVVVNGGVNFTHVNNSIEGIEPPVIPNFDDEFSDLYENLTLQLEQLKNLSFNPDLLNLTQYVDRLNEIAANVSQLNVSVSEFNKYVQYIKWPWYVWLAIFLALILFSFLMLWCCFATGCCGCCGCCGAACSRCCDRPQPVEFEKIHVQ
uniref:Spike glycoprotein n=1 Tax=Mouse coronavirus TaxID=2913384 RepID=A0AA49X6K1_9NIDO|nr:spike glycoprotein [Mouse coronavirus]